MARERQLPGSLSPLGAFTEADIFFWRLFSGPGAVAYLLGPVTLPLAPTGGAFLKQGGAACLAQLVEPFKLDHSYRDCRHHKIKNSVLQFVMLSDTGGGWESKTNGLGGKNKWAVASKVDKRDLQTSESRVVI